MIGNAGFLRACKINCMPLINADSNVLSGIPSVGLLDFPELDTVGLGNPTTRYLGIHTIKMASREESEAERSGSTCPRMEHLIENKKIGMITGIMPYNTKSKSL